MPIHPDIPAALPTAGRASVDVRALVAQGVLRPRGQWYHVLDPARLSESAQCQIATLRLGPDGALIQFRKGGADPDADESAAGMPAPPARRRGR